jgi:hypothetical protein
MLLEINILIATCQGFTNQIEKLIMARIELFVRHLWVLDDFKPDTTE